MRVKPDKPHARRTAGPGLARTRDRADAIVTALEVSASCRKCGKRCFASRRIARYVGRLLYPGKHMGEYRCENLWHITSRPERAKRSRRDLARLAA